MTVAVAMALWFRAHLHKILVLAILLLISLQYLLSGIVDRRSIDIFTANNLKFPRGLIIYGPVAVTNTLVYPKNVSYTTTSSPQYSNDSSKIELAPTMLIYNKSAPTLKTTQMRNISYAKNSLPLCPLEPPNLVGPLRVEMEPPDLEKMEKILVDVKLGGMGMPYNCSPRWKVAIIVPFRDRLQHLHTLLYHLHPILLRQLMEYQIFVIEQKGETQFNRATLMNVGFVEALKEKQFDCFIFHDVDLLPENDKNLYTCPQQPRHMSVAVDKFHYRLPYTDLFGGVSALTLEHFRLVNGFSNRFWGWGGEDDDMSNRIKAHGLHIARYPADIARYKMLNHDRQKPNPKRFEVLKTGKKTMAKDGLSNLHYQMLEKKKYKLYTWLLIKLHRS